MVIVQRDYKQAEAVVVAYEAQDVQLQRLFEEMFGLSNEECEKRGLDIHKLTASSMFGIPTDKVTKAQRAIGKRVRHAVNYSMGPRTLSDQLGVSLAEAKNILSKYLAVNPLIRVWQEDIKRQLKDNGRVLTNLHGRKHKFLDRWGDSLFRSAYSFIPQSTVGDHLNISYVDFYNKYGKDFCLLLQLHDAMYVGCKEDEVEQVSAAMNECMIRPLTSSHGKEFYIDTDCVVSKFWGDME
jgi:DNA polymerase-1